MTMWIFSLAFTLLNFQLIGSVPTLEVDVQLGQHAISHNIYGISFANNTEFEKEIKIPFLRWGGNSVSRYNWKVDASNHANDWFYENQPEANEHTDKLPDGSQTDTFHEHNEMIGARTMLTIPLIGYVTKDREIRCGFSVKKYGEQQKVDSVHTDCGNGLKPDGKTQITGNDPLDTSIPINTTFAEEWVEHLVKRYGNASDKGVLFYEMDNEYDIWHQTHRDVRPKAVGTDEIIELNIKYAQAVKSVDPSAQILGPVSLNYIGLLYSGMDQADPTYVRDDKKQHDNIDFGNYYLKKVKAYEDEHKTRLIDYLDCHYYPQAENIFFPADSQDPKVFELRLRSTRALWDANYTDESWLRDMGGDVAKIQMIPRMRSMVKEYYPGTKTAITEYNFGGGNTLNGALAQADVLGIFGREGLDLAAFWSYGQDTSKPWAYAYRLFRNYDGKGSMFGDTSVMAESSDQSVLSIYASFRSSDKKLTIVVINKDPNDSIETKVTIAGYQHSDTGRVFTYSAVNLTKIIESSIKLTSNDITYKFPAYSITLFELSM